MSDPSHPGAPLVKVIGKAGSAACYKLRDFLYRNGVPFEWVELKTGEQARQMGVESIDDDRLPVCIFSDGTRLESPSAREFAEKLGWPPDPARAQYDLAIYEP